MTIFTDGLRTISPTKGVSQIAGSFGEALGASVSETIDDLPTMQALGINELNAASGGARTAPQFDPLGNATGFGNEPQDDQPPVPMLPRDIAAQRVKAAGLDKAIKLPDQDQIAEPALSIMIDRARERRERQTTIERGPDGILMSGTSLATSFLVGALDPINLASAFIPVMGELRYGKLLASAGEGAFARAGVRAGVGAAEGIVGQAALEPLDWYAHTQDGRDFGMADVLQNLAFGAALGGVIHPAGGFVGDRLRARKGEPLYPFGPNDPLAPPPSSEAIPAMQILADLPPPVHADVMRGALASITSGEPVRAGEMLDAAAALDPRIAESFDVPNRSARALFDEPSSGEVLRMTPDEYLGLSPEMVPNQMKLARLTESVIRGETIREAPSLSIEVNPDGSSGVIAQEGRHRALLAKQMGIDTIPVRIGRSGADVPIKTVRGQDRDTIYNFPEPSGRTVLGDSVSAPMPRDVPPGNPKITLPDVPESEIITKAVKAKTARGRAAADPKTWSLTEHLANEGGLAPHPELEAIYGGKRGPMLSGFGPLIRRQGLTLDDAYRVAKEGGYMFDAADVTGAQAGGNFNDLLRLLTEEQSGRKQYRQDHLAETAYDPEQEAHVIRGQLEAEYVAAGGKASDLDPKLIERTVEIIRREGESDVLNAYERAIMEATERYDGPADIIDTAVHADAPAGAASAAGGQPAAERGPAGLPGQGQGRADGPESRAGGGDDRAARERAFRSLARAGDDADSPAVLEASRAAEELPDPIPSKLDARVAKAEQADAEAKSLYDMMQDVFTPEEREQLNDVLQQIDRESKDVADAIKQGGACMFRRPRNGS